MNKISFPSINASYIEQKVYNIQTSVDKLDPPVTVVALDLLSAVQLFSFLYPTLDILNIVCCGSCVALYPLSFCNE